MKNITEKILVLLAGAALLQSCYPDYVMDYEYSSAYFAYQYDLRTFVYGEEMSIDLGCALAGLTENTRDRKISVQYVPELLKATSLAEFGGEDFATVGAFEALRGSKTGPGATSNDYVKNDIAGSGVTLDQFGALPDDYFTLSADPASLKFKKGNFLASFTLKADEAKLLADTRVSASPTTPYYGLAYKIISADVDSIPAQKSFSIIALRCENTYFGNWYHGGVTKIVNDATSEVISQENYPMVIPTSNTYALTTVSPTSVKVSRLANRSNGDLTLTFDSDEITLSSTTAEIQPIDGQKSCTNGAKLLQDRKMFLSYKFSNSDGTTTFVTDTLIFRNRIRDGINEWQTLNPEAYK